MLDRRVRLPDIIHDMIPQQEVSILAGASGVGKTTLIMQVLRAIQSREPSAFGLRVTADTPHICYIAADRTWASYVRTAEVAGLDLSRMTVRALIDDDSIDLSRFETHPLSILEHLITEIASGRSDPILCVVDPLIVFLGVDTNRYHLNAARLMRLNRFCRQTGVTILGTHHAAKARTDVSYKRAQDRISGTAALLGFTSTQLFMESPEESGDPDGYTRWHIISHHAPARLINLWRNESGQFVHVTKPSTDPARDPAHAILSLFRDRQTLSRKAILERLPSHGTRTIDRYIAKLIAEHTLSAVGHGEFELNVRGNGAA